MVTFLYHFVVNALYLGYFDDVRNVQVCGNRWQAFPNEVSLICLLPVKTSAKDLH